MGPISESLKIMCPDGDCHGVGGYIREPKP